MGRINNAFINTIDANIIARRNMYTLKNYFLGIILKLIKDNKIKFELQDKQEEEIQDIFDNCTEELEEESESGLTRDWYEISSDETITENQIKKIYYELRKNKDKLSFSDADLIIKVLCDYD